jgi:DNA-directed RNA polymerase subunit M/transcription elongation factor TFIIS
MSLPKLNEHLKFTLEIPSTGQKIRYRPYLVKEEKVLLQAFESNDMKAAVSAMGDTLNACIDEKENIRVERLSTFDVEYMFLQLRSKSVGETSTIVISCKECETHNPYEVDLSTVEVDVDRKKDNIVNITDTIKVEMKYPSYDVLYDTDFDDESETAIDTLVSAISVVHYDDTRFECSKATSDEVKDFVLSMTSSQMKEMSEYLSDIPSVSHLAKFKCTKCGTENELLLKGLSDFF